MAHVQNNVDASPTTNSADDVAKSQSTATVVAAVSKPEATETVNLVAKPADSSPSATRTTTTPANTDKKPPTNPGTTASTTSSAPPAVDGTTFRGQPDDFYNAIFYFSGMGSVVGSALSEGVYVSEQYRKCAIDADDLVRDRQATQLRSRGGGNQQQQQQPTEDVVVTARGQAQTLSTDFQKLQTLLESLPVFTGNRDQLPAVVGGSGSIDQPIHGELYFRCKERFPVQPSPSPGSRPPSSRGGSLQTQSSPYDGPPGGHQQQQQPRVEEARRRRQYDDDVLADVAHATAAAFPLMPAPRQPGSRGSTTPVRDVDDQASRRSKRREANSTSSVVSGSSPSPGPSVGYGYQQQQQQYGGRVY